MTGRSACPTFGANMPKPLQNYWPHLAAILSGVALALCFPPFEITELIWIWQAPLLAALWFSSPRKAKQPRWKYGLWLGYLCGLTFFIISQFWLTEVRHAAGSVWGGIGALLGLCGYLALYPALFGAFAATVGRWKPEPVQKEDSSPPAKQKDSHPGLFGGKTDLFDQSIAVLKVAFLNGAAWCGLEWLRGILLTGFGWNGLGVALKDLLMLVQFADVIGITGYGFIMMFVGCVAFCTIVRLVNEVRDRKRLRPHLDFAVGVALVIGLFLYGFNKIVAKPKETVDFRARIMQLNIPLADKWSTDPKLMQKVVFDYRDLTRAFVETSDHDLVLWPETAIPAFFSSQVAQEYFNNHVLKGDDFYLLAGMEETNDFKNGEIYNTITLMQGDTEDYQMYKKIHLVPFGESLPFRDSFPIFKWILGKIIVKDFTAGTEYSQLTMKKGEQEIGIIPLVCFEDTVPRLARKFIKGGGPEVMVNVTNDGWFGESAESLQHFHNALFRCIELRRPMIRAANTGISGFIDERGSVFDREADTPFPLIVQDEETGNTHIRGSLPATVRLDPNPPVTIYARIGDSFSVAMGLIALGFVVVRWVRSRIRKESSE